MAEPDRCISLGEKQKRYLRKSSSRALWHPRALEAAWFRAKRESELDLWTSSNGMDFYGEKRGRYLVSLTALPHIRHPLSKEAFSAFGENILCIER